MWYGSLQNRLAERSSQLAKPRVGSGATIIMYSDRHAATIVEVSANGKRVVVQRDKATRTDKNGQSESQSYTYEPNPDATRETYTLRKNGRYIREKEDLRGTTLLIGRREEYYDPSF